MQTSETIELDMIHANKHMKAYFFLTIVNVHKNNSLTFLQSIHSLPQNLINILGC